MSDDLLDRNLAALLTRALPDDGPSESCRRRVALAVTARLAAPGEAAAARSGPAAPAPRRAARPAVSPKLVVGALAGALAAAALLFGLFQGALFDFGPGQPARGPSVAPHGAGGPWARLGSRGGPLAPEALLDALVAALASANEPAGLTWSALPAGAAAFAVQLGVDAAHAAGGATGPGRNTVPRRAAPRVALDSTGTGAAPDAAEAAPAPPAATLEEASAPALYVRVVAAEDRAPIVRFRAWVKREVFVPQVATPTLTELETERGTAALPVSARKSHTLVIEAEGYAPWRASGLTVNSPEAPVEVALERGVALVGSVLDASTSAPVAGALVFIESALAHDVVEVHAVDLAPLPLHAAITDAAGAFRIEHAPRAEVVLRASHADFAPKWSVTLDLTAVAHDVSDAVQVPPIALETGGTVVGRVERADGSPFEGAEIVLSTLTNRAAVATDPARGTAPARVMTYGAATTDTDGAYRVEHLPAGPFIALDMGDVAAGASMPRMRQTLVTEGGTARVDFLVDGARSSGAADGASGARKSKDAAVLVGHLRDADQTPCADVDLSLFELQSQVWRAARTDAAGRFEFQGVPAGHWALCRATRGFEDQQVLREVDVAPDARGTLEADVTLPRGALTFVVQQSDGRPATSGRLSLKREVAPERFEFHAVLALHSSGRTRVDGLPDGRYRATLVGDTPGLGHVLVGPIVLRGEIEVSERCTLPRGGALVVNVRAEHGGPVQAYVIVNDAAKNELLLGLDPRTDAGGVRRIPCLAAGSYTLEVHALDGRRRNVSCEAREGETAELTVELPAR